SRTDFAILDVGAGATELEARLHTGRTHQIRVHAFATGHPVVGDVKYSSPDLQAEARARGIRRLWPHAQELVLALDGRKVRFEAPVPEDFQRAWQTWAQPGAV